MPHVVIAGPGTIKEFEDAFQPIEEESDQWLVKIENIFCGKFGYKALFPAVVVEEGHKQTFYIVIAKNKTDQRVSARIDPKTDPVRTPGVKRAVALIAENWIHCMNSMHPELSKAEQTNLDRYLKI